MFDVMIDGKLIARANTEQESSIYKLCYAGMKNVDIASSLHIQIDFVKRYTEGGATR